MSEPQAINDEVPDQNNSAPPMDTVTVVFQENLLGLIVVKCEAPDCGLIYDVETIDEHLIGVHEASFMHMMDVPLRNRG